MSEGIGISNTNASKLNHSTKTGTPSKLNRNSLPSTPLQMQTNYDPGFDVPEGAQLWESPKKSGKKTSNFLKSVLADSDVPENQLVSDFGSSRKLEAVIGQSGDDNIYEISIVNDDHDDKDDEEHSSDSKDMTLRRQFPMSRKNKGSPETDVYRKRQRMQLVSTLDFDLNGTRHDSHSRPAEKLDHQRKHLTYHSTRMLDDAPVDTTLAIAKRAAMSKLDRMNWQTEQLLLSASCEARVIQTLFSAGLNEVSDGVRLPKIAVIGAQSHGKSSLFEALTGLDWPRGGSKTTSFPTALTKLKSTHKRLTAKILPTVQVSNAVQNEINTFERYWQNACISKLGDIVKAAEQIVLYQGATGPTNFSSWELAITYESPQNSGAALTLIDTPGLVTSGFPMAEIRTVEQIVRNVVEDEMTLVLNIIQSSIDPETSSSYKLTHEINPTQSRIYTVVSKMDQDPNPWVDTQMKAMLSNSRIKDTHGPMCFLFRGRTSTELQENVAEDIIEARRKDLFDQERWCSYSEFTGDEQIVKYALAWTLANCGRALQDLERQCYDAYQDTKEELNKLPLPLARDTNKDRKNIIRDHGKRLMDNIKSNSLLEADVVIAEYLASEQSDACRLIIRKLRDCQREAIEKAFRESTLLQPARRLFEKNLVKDFHNHFLYSQNELKSIATTGKLADNPEVVEVLRKIVKNVQTKANDDLDNVFREGIMGNDILITELEPYGAREEPHEARRIFLNNRLKVLDRCIQIFDANRC